MGEKRNGNLLARRLTAFYAGIIVMISGLACYFSYQQRRGELLADMDTVLLQAANEYASITEDFWDIYIPIFQSAGQGRETLYRYFDPAQVQSITPLERMELKELLSQMAIRDDRIRWIALFRPERAVNYLYDAALDTLEPLEEDFAYLEAFQNKREVLEIYGQAGVGQTIVMAGGGLAGAPGSTIAVGYDTAALERICGGYGALGSIRFGIVRDGACLFSAGDGDLPTQQVPEPGRSGVLSTDRSTYVRVCDRSVRNARIFCAVDSWELLRLSHGGTPLIVLLVAGVMALSGVLHASILRAISKEVAALRFGLEKIGDNHLDYRIQGDFQDGDFRQIAQSINQMARNLELTRQRMDHYQLRQREAEMQELQAKFNPHFLYNTLELFRARCYQNGDDETAELIAQTAAIFRGFINPHTFIPIREELAFSQRYLALFRARYEDSVKILYDIDTEVLSYGVVRNVFQPLIENYFVHGIDPERTDNFIRFSGCVQDQRTIVLTVEDNGLGIQAERLERLRQSLDEPNTTEKESYGLKNLHQRLRLYYGDGYGLRLRAGKERGLIQELRIGRWTCEEAARRGLQ